VGYRRIRQGLKTEGIMDLTQIIGFLAGFGTTFAALPDLIAMLNDAPASA